MTAIFCWKIQIFYLRQNGSFSVTDPFLTTFYYVEERNEILRKTLLPLSLAALEVFNRCGLHHVRNSILDVFLSPEMTSFEGIFKFRKKWENHRGWSQVNRGLGNYRNAFWGQNFFDEDAKVTWGIVMMEHQFVCNVLSHANARFSEPFKDVLIKKKLGNSCNEHDEDDTGWRLPTLLPKVGTTSPSVCSCPRELFCRG